MTDIDTLIAKVRDSQRTGAPLTMQDMDAIIAALESLRFWMELDSLPTPPRDTP